MNQVNYRSRLSPYQLKTQHPVELTRAKTYDVQDKSNPVREEIEKCVGTHTIKAVVEEDRQTLDVMQADGLVSFLCTLTQDGRVLSQGRGSAIISPTNRYFRRTIACAFNSAFADSAIRASKVLDLVMDKSGAIEEDEASEPATDRQKEYLQQLIQTNIGDKNVRERWESRMKEITKSEASDAIKSLASVR
jgi:hypothetical protein